MIGWHTGQRQPQVLLYLEGTPVTHDCERNIYLNCKTIKIRVYPAPGNAYFSGLLCKGTVRIYGNALVHIALCLLTYANANSVWEVQWVL